MEGSSKYTDRFRLTSVKTEKLLNMFGPFLRRVTNRSRALSEKQLLQIALHWLGTAGNIIQCPTGKVCPEPVHVLFFSSLT